MKTRDRIVKLVGKEPRSGSWLAARLGISKQAVSRHLRDLIRDGLVSKEGMTKGARFRPFDPAQGRGTTRKLALVGLQEDQVLRDLDLTLNLKGAMNERAFLIFRYAFTEMLNNAIDHSQAEACHVTIEVNLNWAAFRIRDRGVGVFSSIREKFGLTDEEAAAAEILKGKATTAPERHSGEGIFFTSKAGERMTLRSHRITLELGPSGEDAVLGRTRFLRGTEVAFRIGAATRRELAAVFQEYSPEEFDFRFERTRVLARLFRGECVSRSTARRLTARLAQFSEVVIDFHGIDTIGQGFADEVFRVFLDDHPNVRLNVVRLKPELKPMIAHVMTPADQRRVAFEDPA